MLKVGEFSRLSQVTVKTLHHYDEIGLLKPAHIDPFTAYRYYSVDQLPRLHRIMALKELGLSLEQVKDILDEALSPDEIRGMLRLQRAEVQQHLRAEQARLAQVDFRLRMIEMEDTMPDLDVIVKAIPPVHALTLRTSISQPDPSPTLLRGQREIEQALTQHQIKLAGPVIEIHYAEEFKLDWLDIELVHLVDATQTEDVPLETVGTLIRRVVPGLPLAATYMQHGFPAPGLGLDHFTETLAVLQRWIVANGYKLCGTHRLIHHHGPMEHAEYADWITEFQHEIAPAE